MKRLKGSHFTLIPRTKLNKRQNQEMQRCCVASRVAPLWFVFCWAHGGPTWRCCTYLALTKRRWTGGIWRGVKGGSGDGANKRLSCCRRLLLNRTLSLALCETVRVTIEMNLKVAMGGIFRLGCRIKSFWAPEVGQLKWCSDCCYVQLLKSGICGRE